MKAVFSVVGCCVGEGFILGEEVFDDGEAGGEVLRGTGEEIFSVFLWLWWSVVVVGGDCVEDECGQNEEKRDALADRHVCGLLDRKTNSSMGRRKWFICWFGRRLWVVGGGGGYEALGVVRSDIDLAIYNT